jgi:hypothetical protein
MALTIGRVGTDITFADPQEVQQSGGTVTLRGVQVAASRVQALAWRDQMVGLSGSVDEPVVPVTFSLAPELDGMYEVLATDVALPPGAAGPSGSSGFLVFPWSAQLRQVSSSSAPTMETTLVQGGPIPNAVSMGNTTRRHWLPSTVYQAIGKPNGGGVWSVGTYTRALASGGTVVDSMPGSYTSSSVDTYRVEWAVPIGDFYDGAVRIETAEIGSSTYYRTVGRQIRQGVLWRINNDVMRVSEHPSTAGAFRCEWWDGSAWDSKDFQFENFAATANVDSIRQVRVLRNSPEQCVLRLWCGLGSSKLGVVTIDINLRRGDRLASFTCNYDEPLNAAQWRCKRTATEASSNVTDGGFNVGIRATANDASGNRFCLFSDYGTSRDLVNGRITDTTAQVQCRFGIGLEVGGSGAIGVDVAASFATDFFSAASETQRVIAR